MFDRLIKLIGNDKFLKLNSSSVLVLGCGGVGSYAVESLARNGIGTIILVDNDVVDITNINRQVEALNSTVGLKKVDVLESRIKDINPLCKVIKIDKFIDESNITECFTYNIDYAIDACDTISTKKVFIKECINKNIKFICSCGTGNKFNPSLLKITKIDKTSYDPIAKILRKWALDNRISNKISVVSSTEKPLKVSDHVVGSCSIVPNTAGILCASYVINDIIK